MSHEAAQEELRRELIGLVKSLKEYMVSALEAKKGVHNLTGKGPAGSGEGGEGVEIVETPVSLEAVREEIDSCRKCALWSSRKTIVVGEGHPRAALLFVGEGPGADEDLQGRPFVGRAGQLLTRIIEAMGLTREQVYIANIVKCRPPGNRTPKPEEVDACTPYLAKQIKAIRPKVICALGSVAARYFLQSGAPVSVLRGRFHDYDGISLMVTYHPAYLLRNPGAKKQAWEDVQQIMKRLSD